MFRLLNIVFCVECFSGVLLIKFVKRSIGEIEDG